MTPFQEIMDAPAMLSDKERMGLWQAAASLLPGSVIVDLGTSSGGSAYLFRHSSPQSRVYTIDINDKMHSNVCEDPELTVFRGNAQAFSEAFAGLKADMVFIDASHYFFDVVEDFKIMTTLLKDGGVIAFHDCLAPKFPGIATICKTLSDTEVISDAFVFDSLFIGQFRNGASFPRPRILLKTCVSSPRCWVSG